VEPRPGQGELKQRHDGRGRRNHRSPSDRQAARQRAALDLEGLSRLSLRQRHASYLPKAFDEASFDFYSKTLRDVPTQRDRWKRGVSLVNGALGEAVGQIYVQRHYPPKATGRWAS
jgi:predicted metalloendopeptidase